MTQSNRIAGPVFFGIQLAFTSNAVAGNKGIKISKKYSFHNQSPVEMTA